MQNPGHAQPSFREWIARASRENSTKTILAIDIDTGPPDTGLERASYLLDKTGQYLCAVKLSRQTVLNLGTTRTAQLVKRVHQHNLPTIIDDKLNDIGETNKAIARAYFRLGLDALTANPFAGWKKGLQPLFQTAHTNNKGVILLTYMSHPGADESYGQLVLTKESNKPKPQYILFAEKAARWKADGVVVGATRPKILKEVKTVLGKKVPIYSPGIGTQGGDITKALEAGTAYLIIGRSISKTPHPRETAARIANMSRQ